MTDLRTELLPELEELKHRIEERYKAGEISKRRYERALRDIEAVYSFMQSDPPKSPLAHP